MSGKAQTQAEHAALEQVLQTPPPDWVNPGGSGVPDPRVDQLSWEVEVLSGLPDSLTGQIAQARPMVERLRVMVRRATAARDEFLLGDYSARLGRIEPTLKRNEALLKCCVPWVGRSPKKMEARLREAEGLVAAVVDEKTSYTDARAIVLAASPDAGVVEAALIGADRSQAAKLGASQAAVAVARAERDANLEALSTAKAKLDRLAQTRK